MKFKLKARVLELKIFTFKRSFVFLVSVSLVIFYIYRKLQAGQNRKVSFHFVSLLRVRKKLAKIFYFHESLKFALQKSIFKNVFKIFCY